MTIVTNGDEFDAIAQRVGSENTNRPVLNATADQAAAMAANMVSTANNATLRKDEWELIDARVNEEARNRLTVFEAFRSRGLIQSVGIGDIIRITERLAAFDDAEISFDGRADPQMDYADYKRDSVPVPIISKDFEIGFRQLASSNRRGNNLSTDSAGLAMRTVAHKMQDLITNGLSAGGPTGTGIDGLTTATNGISVTLGTAWDLSGADIIGDVKAMLAAAYADYFFGPFVLMVPKNWWATIQDDYSTQKGDRTFLERILAFEDIDAVLPNDSLADDTAVMVQMTRDVMDISLALAPTTWQWQKNQAATRFRVLMIGGPHVKSVETQAGNTRSGIITLS